MSKNYFRIPKEDRDRLLSGDLTLKNESGKIEIGISEACIYLRCAAIDRERSDAENLLNLTLGGQQISLTPEEAQSVGERLIQSARNHKELTELLKAVEGSPLP
jgi:hypothetical protein